MDFWQEHKGSETFLTNQSPECWKFMLTINGDLGRNQSGKKKRVLILMNLARAGSD